MIERINDLEINQIFKEVTEHLSKLYEPIGGGDTLFIFSDPIKKITYKAFIRDIKTIDEPYIIIRKSS